MITKLNSTCPIGFQAYLPMLVSGFLLKRLKLNLIYSTHLRYRSNRILIY